MRFDIATLNSTYRGIERSLNTDDFYTPKLRSFADELITCYFSYLDLMYSPYNTHPYNERTFNELTEYYLKFKSCGVNCEIIVYDNSPIDNAFGKQIELLGIDVAHDLSESLLGYPNSISDIVKKHLNSFGLCRELSDVDLVLDECSCGNTVWQPCWVHKVLD